MLATGFRNTEIINLQSFDRVTRHRENNPRFASETAPSPIAYVKSELRLLLARTRAMMMMMIMIIIIMIKTLLVSTPSRTAVC